MTPIILCLCSLAAIVLWSVNVTLNAIKSAIIATIELIIKIVICMAGLAVLYGVFYILVAIATDPSLLGELFGDLLQMILILVVAGIGIAIVVAIVFYLGSWIWAIIEFIIGLILTAYDWLEEKTHDGYNALLRIITNRVCDD